MPVFYEHINDFAKIAIWHIAEEKNFFLEKVPLHREITHPHKQLQHLAGRYLLQYLYPDFPYHLIEIADTRKPFLANEKYHFSISHCGDYAAVIVSKTHRAGIDIELVSEKVERIKHKFLNDKEMLLVNGQSSLVNRQSSMPTCPPGWPGRTGITELDGVNGQSDNQLVNNLTLLWCCKEAVFKWYGNGGVDFKDDIILYPEDMYADEGIIECDFMKIKNRLVLNYKIFNGLCKVSVVTG